MRPRSTALLLVVLTLLAGCATPESRIAGNRAVFDKFPPPVQEKVRAGRIELGFAPEMVRLALGEPARKFTHQYATGDTELWIYHDDSPQFSFGLGVGTGGRNSSVGGGIGMTSGGYDPDEKVRVEFRDGRVSAIDYAGH